MLAASCVVGVLAGPAWLALLLGAEGRAYLPLYLYASSLCALGLERVDTEITVEGTAYHGPAVEVRDWLAEHVYVERSVCDLLRHWLWSSTLAASGMMAGLVWLVRRKRSQASTTLRGRKQVNAKTLAKRIRAPRLPRVCGAPVPSAVVRDHTDGRPRVLGLPIPTSFVRKPVKLGVHLAGICIPEEVESQSILLSGDTGQGKSTVIREILAQLRSRNADSSGGPPVVVYDPEREFVQEFFDPRCDTILNPCDARSPAWDLWAEFETREDVPALVRSLIPDTDDTHTAYFRQGARAVLCEILRRCSPRTPGEIVRWLTLPDAELARLVDGTPAAKFINPKAPQQAAGVTSTLAGWVQAFEVLPRPEDCPGRWSATVWMRDPRGWLFLTRRESDEDAVLPLHTV